MGGKNMDFRLCFWRSSIGVENNGLHLQLVLLLLLLWIKGRFAKSCARPHAGTIIKHRTFL